MLLVVRFSYTEVQVLSETQTGGRESQPRQILPSKAQDLMIMAYMPDADCVSTTFLEEPQLLQLCMVSFLEPDADHAGLLLATMAELDKKRGLLPEVLISTPCDTRVQRASRSSLGGFLEPEQLL